MAKLRVRGVAYLEGKRWCREATTEAQGLDGATVAGLRLSEDCSGEHGPDEAERERAHRRVSRVADSEAELTVALDGAHTRRRPQNRQWSTAGGGGAPCTRGQSERKGKRVWQRAQMREGRWASRARGSKGQRVHGRGQVHGGQIVGGRLGTTDKWGRQDRERERAHAREPASTGRPHSAARERGEVSALRFAPTGGARLSGTGCARAGLIGLTWAEMAFSFFLEFLLPFLFIFSRVFNSNSNQVSNSNQIKYMQQLKEYLGSILCNIP
jgi:hypothetical protein